MSEASIKPKILAILCQNGEMSRDALRILSDSRQNKTVQIKNLLDAGIIREGRIKNLNNEKRYYLYHIETKYPTYEKYVYKGAKESAKTNLKSIQTANIKRHKRAMRQSEIMAVMLEMGVKIGDKPFLPLSDMADVESYYYYDSRELKARMEENKKEGKREEYDVQTMKRSRAMGSLYAGGEIYVVFDAEKNDYIELNHRGESVYYGVTEILFGKKNRERKRIIYINSYQSLKGFLYKELYKKDGRNTKKVAFLDDAFYHNTLLIPKNADGVRIGYIITTPNAKHMLDEYLGMERGVTMSSVECDGIKRTGEETEFIFNFLYPDITRLKRFISSCRINKNPGNQYTVHCYEEAAKYVKELEPKMQVVSHDLSRIYHEFLLKA